MYNNTTNTQKHTKLYTHQAQMIITTITIHTQCTNDDYNNNHTHKAQMMITTTAIHTQCTIDDYNNNHTCIVHKQ